MDTLSMERVMQQCWSEAWPQVAAAAEEKLSVASGMEVMQRMLGLMKQVCAAGYRSWLEQSDATEPVLEREGEVLRFKLVSEKEFFTFYYSRLKFAHAAHISGVPEIPCTAKGLTITAQGHDAGAHPGKQAADGPIPEGVERRVRPLKMLRIGPNAPAPAASFPMILYFMIL